MEDKKERNFDLTGKLLVAMPSVDLGIWERSVVFVTSCSKDGILSGLIVNKVIEGLNLNNILRKVGITYNSDLLFPSIYMGGPIELNKVFILHSDDYSDQHSEMFECGIGINSSYPLIEKLSKGDVKPRGFVVILGYSAWSFDMIEKELLGNFWNIIPANSDLVLDTPKEKIWDRAMEYANINISKLSTAYGQG